MTDATIPAAQSSTTAARTRSDLRTRALWAAALLLFAAPALLAFRSGVNPVADFEREQTLAAGAALAVLAVLAVSQPWPLVRRGLPLIALASMTALAGWTAL